MAPHLSSPPGDDQRRAADIGQRAASPVCIRFVPAALQAFLMMDDVDALVARWAAAMGELRWQRRSLHFLAWPLCIFQP